MDNIDIFDNICIDSSEFNHNKNDVKVANHNDSNHCKSSIGDVCLDYIIHDNCNNEPRMASMLDESSDEDDNVTFIQQISTPLLNNSGGYSRLKRRQYIQHRKKMTKVIGICFILTLLMAFIFVGFLLCLPSKVLQKLNRKLHVIFIGPKTTEVIGCDHLLVEDVWVKSYPRMLSEGAIRLVKINNDDVFDFVIPFGTNVGKTEYSHFTCAIYYPGHKRCFGGLLAVDGRNGDVLWTYDASGEMYALTCTDDLNKDGWIDCVGAGRVGTLAAVSGRNGEELWAFDKNSERNAIMNLYTPQFVDDIDGDGIRDIVDMHGGDPVAKPNEMNRLIAKLIVFSGRTGQILASKNVADSHESYYSPQIINAGDGAKSILYGTGGETFPGDLFVSSLKDLLYSPHHDKLTFRTVYKGPKKGVMTPPVLVDLNSDGREDIVICPFGDVCMAFDGITLKELWTFDRINSSETYASPAAGYYNEDNVPDIFVQLFVGLGYPVYFYGETIILDGRNGKVIKRLGRSNNVVTTSPLTLSIEGKGNDIFLYWLQMCRGHENDVDATPFQNVPQYLLSRAHVCKIRFNSTTASLYLAHGRNLNNQSIDSNQLYNNENYYLLPNDIAANSTWQIQQFLKQHPELRELHRLYEQMLTTGQSDDEEDYANDMARKKYHEQLITEQRDKGNVDLNDESVHKSIDFESPVSKENSGNTDNGDQDFKAFFNKMQRDRDQDEDIPLIRTKRHNGPHDGEGQQRLLSTGTLAPPMLAANNEYFNQSMDVVFSTYWSKSKEVVLQTGKEIECNKRWMDKEYQRYKDGNKFRHYDHDHYSEYGNKYCAKKYGRRSPPTKIEKGTTIFDSHEGQLTVFRKRIRCTCSKSRLRPNNRCSRILPFHLQAWPAYLGLAGTGYWNASYYNLHKV